MTLPLIQDLMTFLHQSPTPWHAVEQIKQKLSPLSFTELHEHQAWKIEAGKGYFVRRNGSLCAFITPLSSPVRLRLLASHTDSPCFKLKPSPEIRKHRAILLATEIYGSPLLSSWLNRDLGIAGRVTYLDRQQQLQESLIQLDQHPLTIPQLAIHLDREVNEKGLNLNKQEHLHALAALETDFLKDTPYLQSLIKQLLEGCEEILHFDLFLFPLEKPRLLGYQQQLLASYRIDSLSSVHAALEAFIQEPAPLQEDIKMILFWNHEEIGSRTAQGADSPFFHHLLERIFMGLRLSREDYLRLLHQSLCVSIDLAHALHPNYAEKHDAQHQPYLGQGVVLKTSAQQRYASDARSLSMMQTLARQAAIPLQTFVSRNDLPSGTTIGPIHAGSTGMPTVDLGCAQLSMHACREVMACQDHLDMCKLLHVTLNTTSWPIFKGIK